MEKNGQQSAVLHASLILFKLSTRHIFTALTHPEGQSMVFVRGAAEVAVAKKMNKKEAAIRTQDA